MKNQTTKWTVSDVIATIPLSIPLVVFSFAVLLSNG